MSERALVFSPLYFRLVVGVCSDSCSCVGLKSGYAPLFAMYHVLILVIVDDRYALMSLSP